MRRAAIVAAGLLAAGVAGGQPAPTIPDPDLPALLRRLAPHLDQPAGLPAGAVKAKAPYAGEAFDEGRPERVMPTGAGRLSAMVSYGDAVELQLSTTEYFNEVDDDTAGQMGHYINPLLSPGKLVIRLDHASPRDFVSFAERIDFDRGAVVIDAQTRQGRIEIQVWGDMAENNLLALVQDRRPGHGAASVRYENWRPSVQVQANGGRLLATEAVDPAKESGLRAQSMSLAVQVGCRGTHGFVARADGASGAIDVPAALAGGFIVVVSAKCAHGAPPVEAAEASWQRTAAHAPEELEAARLAWWKSYWAPAWLDLQGPQADYLMRLWYTTLYTYACVGQGPMLPKFNGGPGLVYKDSRAWGDGYWWQNQREISFWPLAAAGHADFTRRSILFFSHDLERCAASAREHGLPGLLFGEGHRPAEWSEPFGQSGRARPEAPPSAWPTDAGSALAKRQATKPGYNALNFVGGFEFVQAIFDYVQFTGDETIARTIGAPWLKGEALAGIGLLTEEGDHRFHVRCADATEQWWKVDDPAPLLAGIRYVLTLAVRHGPVLGIEPELIEDARRHLERLAPLPTVESWHYQPDHDGKLWFRPAVGIEPGAALLAPFRIVPGIIAHNGENPELYAVFPFGFGDLNGDRPDLDRARRTFRHRFFQNNAGWSQCPVQAARLGLPNTVDLIVEHAKKHQLWPYGGWNSPGSLLYAGCPVTDCPYLDGAGVNATALEEALLQSHAPVGESALAEGGPLRLIPAVSRAWSGEFQLRARGGFVVTVTFAKGAVTAARIEATRTARLTLVNPFEESVVWRGGRAERVAAATVTAELSAGAALVLTPADVRARPGA